MANPLGAPTTATPYVGPLPGPQGQAGLSYSWEMFQQWWTNGVVQAWNGMQDNINALEQGIG